MSLQALVPLLAEPDNELVNEAWSAVNAVALTIPKETQPAFVRVLRVRPHSQHQIPLCQTWAAPAALCGSTTHRCTAPGWHGFCSRQATAPPCNQPHNLALRPRLVPAQGPGSPAAHLPSGNSPGVVHDAISDIHTHRGQLLSLDVVKPLQHMEFAPCTCHGVCAAQCNALLMRTCFCF